MFLTVADAVEILELAHNSLMQQIPTELGELTALKGCDLSSNFLTGPMPDEISALVSLQTFRLRGTISLAYVTDTVVEGLLWGNASVPRLTTGGVLTGKFPASLANLENLACLDTTGTLLTGTAPESLCADGGAAFRYITVDCSYTDEPCSCCVCNGPDYCDIL